MLSGFYINAYQAVLDCSVIIDQCNSIRIRSNCIDVCSFNFASDATDAVRDQVVRYNPNSAVYSRAYINKRVPFDVLSAVLERLFYRRHPSSSLV